MSKADYSSRKMDELGRIVIPQKIRDQFQWGEGTELHIEMNDISGESIVIRKARPTCVICRKDTDDLIELGDRHICKVCGETLAAKLGK